MKSAFRVLPVVLLACAAAAQACSSCARPDQGDGATARGAYYGTAIFMTLLPGLLVFALVWWIRRQGLAGGAETPAAQPGGAGGR